MGRCDREFDKLNKSTNKLEQAIDEFDDIVGCLSKISQNRYKDIKKTEKIALRR